ncbi:hypothetical protein CKO09_08720 [Chromatium weissei]|nr:hypothetical protein [Chromatium weissei]
MEKISQLTINAVSKKLKNALDKKMQSGNSQDVARLLKEAYQIANNPIKLSPPWPQITAYRLAHVLMRFGDKIEWTEVDRLLEEASAGDGILGAMPWIYRLVSLQKCNAPRERLQHIYQTAVSKLNSQTFILNKPPLDKGHLVQSNAVNLLEMATYFTGLDYEPLEGRIDLENDFFADLGVGQSAWFVLDSRDAESIAYPESIARQIFTQRRKDSDCLAIEYDGDVYLSNKVVEHKFTYQHMCDWYLRLNNFSSYSRRNNRKCITDTERTQEAERQNKKRFRDALKDLGFTLDESRFDRWWIKNSNSKSVFNSPIDIPVIMLINPKFLKKHS